MRTLRTGLLFTLALFLMLPPLFGLKYTDERQEIYNAFGERLGASDYLILDYHDVNAVNGTDDDAYSRFFKQGRRLNWYKFYGVMVMQDDLAWNMSYQLGYYEANKRTFFSSYILANNSVNGLFLDWEKEGVLDIQSLFSFLTTDSLAYESIHAENLDYEEILDLATDESDILYGASATLTFLNSINTPQISFHDVHFSWVGQVHRDKRGNASLFTGNASISEENVTNLTDPIYIKVRAFSSAGKSNFAALYGAYIEVDGARRYVGVSEISGIDTSQLTYDDKGRLYCRISEDTPFTFSLSPTNTTSKGRVKVGLILANSFLVQNYHRQEEAESYENPQLSYPEDAVIVSSKQDIYDFSNFGEYVFYYGHPTANHNFGVEGGMNVMGVDVEFGLFGNLRFFQAPIHGSALTSRMTLAYYLNASKAIGPVVLTLKNYYTDPAYYTRFTSTYRDGASGTHYMPLSTTTMTISIRPSLATT